MQGISAKERLVCWTNPTSSVLTPVICDLRIGVYDAVVAILRLGRSLALPTRGTSFLITTIGYLHGHAETQILHRRPFRPFRPRIAHGDLA